MHRMAHPLGVIVTGRYYLTRTLSSMKFFPFRIRNKPVLQLACSILHLLNQNFLTVYNVQALLENTLNTLTSDGVDSVVLYSLDVLDTSQALEVV